MRVVLLPACAVALALSANLAFADDKAGRFTMTPADGGALKLDTVTGATSFCTRASGEWVCTPTKDGDQAMRREIEGLKGEVLVLKEQLTKMEEIAGIGDPSKDPPGGRGKVELPTEKDVDQAFDYVERMVRKLRERLNKVEQETKPSPLPGPAPSLPPSTKPL
jgi:hypothetical protein